MARRLAGQGCGARCGVLAIGSSKLSSEEDKLETVTVHEAKTHLERLIEEVAAGAEIVISKNGVARAKLVPVSALRKLEFGVMKGKLRYPDNFNASLPHEVLALFKGRRPAR